MYMIFSIDAKKALDQIKYPFKIKSTPQTSNRKNFFILMKGIYENPQLISHLMVENWMLFPS